MRYVFAVIGLLLFIQPAIACDEVIDQIKESVAARYPDSYSLQETLVNAECEAYDKLQNYEDDRVPYDVLSDILERVARRFPTSYSLQETLVNAEIESYLKLHN